MPEITPLVVRTRWAGPDIEAYIQTPSEGPFTLAIHWMCFYMIKARK